MLRLTETHDAQCQLLVGMAHGIYCDPNTSEPARLNALDLCGGLKKLFNASIKSDLINKHSEYVAQGKEDKHTASLQFFEKLGMLLILNESEQHVVFSRAIDRLWNVHNGMNNFYNEPPFAERLLELSKQGAVPETVREHFVQTVCCCRVGNGYGVSNAAVPDYDQMIKSFSPGEIVTMIRSATSKSNSLGRRILHNSSCRIMFKEILGLIDSASISSGIKADYDKLMR
jgi:hypothetical protein